MDREMNPTTRIKTIFVDVFVNNRFYRTLPYRPISKERANSYYAKEYILHKLPYLKGKNVEVYLQSNERLTIKK